MEEYDKLSQWTQAQLIEREKQMQAIRDRMDQAGASQETSQQEAKEVVFFLRNNLFLKN